MKRLVSPLRNVHEIKPPWNLLLNDYKLDTITMEYSIMRE